MVLFATLRQGLAVDRSHQSSRTVNLPLLGPTTITCRGASNADLQSNTSGPYRGKIRWRSAARLPLWIMRASLKAHLKDMRTAVL